MTTITATTKKFAAARNLDVTCCVSGKLTTIASGCDPTWLTQTAHSPGTATFTWSSR